MSVSTYDAYHAEEFHTAHSGLPCTIWKRAGHTHDTAGGGYFTPIARHDTSPFGDPIRRWWHITRVTAGDFHTPADCPREHSDPSEDSPAPGPVLVSEDGRDVLGYDEHGYDANGFDSDGFNEDGFNEDGFNADGYNEDGYGRDGYNAEGLNSEGYTRAGDRYCSDCDDAPCICDTTVCDRCGDREPNDEITKINGEDICGYCRSHYYTYCEDCEEYYPDNEGHSHDQEDDGCCPVLRTRFTIRNDGCPPLANDTRITITMPVGTIDAEGLTAIRHYLGGQGLWDLSCDLDPVGDQWQTKDGNFTKRLSRHAYQAHLVKISPEAMSQVGCIARDHSKAVDVRIEVSRELNQSAADWYHEDSCWWGSYSESRCALKSNGGFGIRSFSEHGNVAGRAWVLPLRLDESYSPPRLVPTFETMTPDAFVVFNGYGDLSGYAPARVLAHMAGWTYRKVDYDDDTMYVNSGGYLIAPEDLAEKYTDGSVYTYLRRHSSLFDTERELAHA